MPIGKGLRHFRKVAAPCVLGTVDSLKGKLIGALDADCKPNASVNSRVSARDVLTRAYFGPFLKFGNYEPQHYLWTASILIVARGDLIPIFSYSSNSIAGATPQGVVLDTYAGYAFYRFSIEVVLQDEAQTVEYTIFNDRRYLVHLPSRWESWRWVFYSCNGFHNDKAEEELKGIQPLWTDLMKQHRLHPYHLQVGGGDQIYNDPVWDVPSCKEYMQVCPVTKRVKFPMTDMMLAEVEEYYFLHYCQHFSEAVFEEALATIPFVFVWDDHDIFDGWGSYPEYLQLSPVFQGIFRVAQRFYMLFQLHCTTGTVKEFNSTIGDGGHTVLKHLGSSTALLVLDTRTERSKDQLLPPDTHLKIASHLLHLPQGIRHLVVVATVPVVYPKIPLSEQFLGSLSGSRKGVLAALMQKSGLSSKFMSCFDEPDILDDLNDHWTAKGHTQERQDMIHYLQKIAAEKLIRVTFISGDVHVAGFGRFYTYPKLADLQMDHRYMEQVISSAIGNTPPPQGVVQALQSTSVARHLDPVTREKMVRKFPHDAKIHPHRNYCEIFEEYSSESTTNAANAGSLMFVIRCQHPRLPVEAKIDTWDVTIPVLRGIA